MKFAIAVAAIMWSLVAVKAMHDKEATAANSPAAIVIVQADASSTAPLPE